VSKQSNSVSDKQDAVVCGRLLNSRLSCFFARIDGYWKDVSCVLEVDQIYGSTGIPHGSSIHHLKFSVLPLGAL
jgi:hypothetical protein